MIRLAASFGSFPIAFNRHGRRLRIKKIESSNRKGSRLNANIRSRLHLIVGL